MKSDGFKEGHDMDTFKDKVDAIVADAEARKRDFVADLRQMEEGDRAGAAEDMQKFEAIITDLAQACSSLAEQEGESAEEESTQKARDDEPWMDDDDMDLSNVSWLQ